MNTFKKRSAADAAPAAILPNPKRPRLSPTRDADVRVLNHIIEDVDSNKESPALDRGLICDDASLTGSANNPGRAEVLAQLYRPDNNLEDIQNDSYCSPEVVSTDALFQKIAKAKRIFEYAVSLQVAHGEMVSLPNDRAVSFTTHHHGSTPSERDILNCFDVLRQIA